jgi:hypothetical protein
MDRPCLGMGKEAIEELNKKENKEKKRRWWNDFGEKEEPQSMFLVETFEELLMRARRFSDIDTRVGEEMLKKIINMGQSDINLSIPSLHINLYLYRTQTSGCQFLDGQFDP